MRRVSSESSPDSGRFDLARFDSDSAPGTDPDPSRGPRAPTADETGNGFRYSNPGSGPGLRTPAPRQASAREVGHHARVDPDDGGSDPFRREFVDRRHRIPITGQLPRVTFEQRPRDLIRAAVDPVGLEIDDPRLANPDAGGRPAGIPAKEESIDRSLLHPVRPDRDEPTLATDHRIIAGPFEHAPDRRTRACCAEITDAVPPPGFRPPRDRVPNPGVEKFILDRVEVGGPFDAFEARVDRGAAVRGVRTPDPEEFRPIGVERGGWPNRHRTTSW